MGDARWPDAARCVAMTLHCIDGKLYVLAEDAHRAVKKAREQEGADVSAREAAAAAAMREAAQKRIETQLDLFKRCAAGPNMTGEDYTEGYREACEHGVNNIDALPLPGGGALAEALAKARREGIEAAVAWLHQRPSLIAAGNALGRALLEDQA